MSLATMDEFGRHFAESRVAVVSLLVSLAFLLCAIFAPVIAPTNPYDLSQLQLADALKPVGSPKVVPGGELRVRVAVANGTATFEDLPEGSAIKAITAEACGEKCLDVGVEPADVALESLQIRGLPPGLSVEGASKHPVQPWWTVAPADGKARIVSEGALPSDFSFLAIVKSAPQETGFVFRLGTDSFGRDMLSAILYGIRISVIVGLVAAGTAMVLGIGLGLLAAWMGGTVDAIIMRAVDFMLGFPALLVGLAVLLRHHYRAVVLLRAHDPFGGHGGTGQGICGSGQNPSLVACAHHAASRTAQLPAASHRPVHAQHRLGDIA
jgi:peptide/nickel transport system permease protein